MGADHSIPTFTSLVDLASARVGGRAIAASDDFFAPKTNLVKAEPPVFVPGKYTTRGKWMDGWESRRKRTPGHDWCVVKLGMRGRIRGFNVSTAFFTGNFPPHCSIHALDAVALDAAGAGFSRPTTSRPDAAPWVTILPKAPLQGDSDNFFVIEDERPWTHLRLDIYPDGGVARLRVYGDVLVDWSRVTANKRFVDLAAVEHGGLVIAVSDMHYGAKDNVIMPGRARNMADGWETKRRRGPGNDWLILRLGAAGHIRKIEIDTNHFKGNYPDSASLEGCFVPAGTLVELGSAVWRQILPQTKLRAHHRHFFASELRDAAVVSHVRLNIFPDGGISRLRVHGTLAQD